MSDVLHILRGLPFTLGLTLASLVFGAVLGLPIMAMRQSRYWIVRLIAIALFSFIRAIPPIVWLFIIFFGLGSGIVQMTPFTACLVTFGLIAAVNMAEIYRGGLISINHGQFEAAKALNFNRWYTFRDVVAPQMFRVALPSSATYTIGLFKDSAIASTIGVQEMAYQATKLSQTTFRGIEVFATAGLLYILISLPIAWLSRMADGYIKAKVAR